MPEFQQVVLFTDLAANDRKLRGSVGVLEAPISSRVCTTHCGLELLRQRIGGTEGRHLVFGNCNTLDMAAPDERPAGVTPAAQALKLVGCHDVLVGDDAVMSFPVPGALLLRVAAPFTAGPLPLFQAPTCVPVGLNGSQRGNRRRFQDGSIGNCRPKNLQQARNCGPCLLFLALRIGYLAGDVAKFARGLDDRPELRDICHRSMRFDFRCDLVEFLLGLGHGALRILHRAGLRTAAIEQTAKERNLGLGGNACDQLIDIFAPIKLAGEAVESCFCRGQFRPPLGQIGFPGANLNAAITELCDVFGTCQ